MVPGLGCVGVWVYGCGGREKGKKGWCLTHEANMQPELMT